MRCNLNEIVGGILPGIQQCAQDDKIPGKIPTNCVICCLLSQMLNLQTVAPANHNTKLFHVQ